jgi:hypothetical protein
MFAYDITYDNLGRKGHWCILPIYDGVGSFCSWMTGAEGHVVPLTQPRGLVTLCYRGPLPTEEQVRARVGPIDREGATVMVPFCTTDEDGVVEWGLFVRAD